MLKSRLKLGFHYLLKAYSYLTIDPSSKTKDNTEPQITELYGKLKTLATSEVSIEKDFTLGVYALLSGEAEVAILQFTKCLSLEDTEILHYFLSRGFLELGDLPRAQDEIENALNLRESSRNYYQLANVLNALDPIADRSFVQKSDYVNSLILAFCIDFYNPVLYDEIQNFINTEDLDLDTPSIERFKLELEKYPRVDSFFKETLSLVKSNKRKLVNVATVTNESETTILEEFPGHFHNGEINSEPGQDYEHLDDSEDDMFDDDSDKSWREEF